MNSLREKDIEKKLVKAVKARGGMCPKFVSPGWDGAPDRIILLPGGRMAFSELKAPGRKLRPLQESRKRKLESLGFKVYVIDRPEQIPDVLKELQNAIDDEENSVTLRDGTPGNPDRDDEENNTVAFHDATTERPDQAASTCRKGVMPNEIRST